MKPKKFKEHNVIFAKNQPEYRQLPAFKNDSEKGEVVTCWELSFIERLRVLFFGEVWMNMLTFHRPLTPTLLTTKKSDLLTTEE